MCRHITAAFTTAQRFDTREAVVSWAREIRIRNKVIVTITRSDTETGKRGRSNKLILGWDKGGRYKRVKSSTQSASKKCDCPFKNRSTLLKDGLGWKVEVKCGFHNHGLPNRLEGHTFVGRLSADEHKRVEDLAKRRVPPRHILLSLQETLEKFTLFSHLFFSSKFKQCFVPLSMHLYYFLFTQPQA